MSEGNDKDLLVEELEPVESSVELSANDFEDTFTDVPEVVEDEPVVDQAEVPVASATPNAILTDSYSTPLSEDAPGGPGMPSLPLKEFTEKVTQFSNIADSMGDVLKTWRSVLEEAVEQFTPAGHMQERFTDSDSEFKQGVEQPSGLKTISAINFKQTTGEVRGELALMKVAKFLGLGEVVNVPLPHSGIWVTIKPPAEQDLIDFYNMVFREKIVMGRATSGYTLTNMSVHINNRLFDFILKHVHSVNYEEISKEELDKRVNILDFPILAWGFACSMYPNGFDYERACMNDIEKCTHIEKAKLNLSKLLWIDNSSLSEVQKTILGENRPNKLKLVDYEKYRSEHQRTKARTVKLSNGIEFKLRIPTFSEYTADGLKWVNTITNVVERALMDSEADEEVRLETLNQYVKASILKQYNFYVESIIVDGSVISDRSTIDSTLALFSSDDTIRGELTKEIIDFKAKSSIAVIGIPEYKCPVCKTEQKLENPGTAVTNVIPLDVMNVFFLTLTSRISKILDRVV